MTTVIAIIGGIIALMSALVIVAAGMCLHLVRRWRHTRSTQLRYLASVVRIVVGVVLIIGAPATHYPLTVQIIGWAVLAVGVVFLLVGTATFERILDWVLDWLSQGIIRVGGLMGMALGVFLILAATQSSP